MQNSDLYQKNYAKLNPKQKEAVDKIDGPVLVIAGPGSGKTQLLALRVANILRETDTNPSSILCLTFTDSAAQNMVNRLTDFIGKDAYKVAIHTFHSFATEVINHNPEYFFSGAVYKPADNLAQYKILNDIFDNLEFDSPFKNYSEDYKYTYLSDVQNAISTMKREGITPAIFSDIINQNKIFLDATKDLVSDFFSQNTRNITLESLRFFIDSVISIVDKLTIEITLPSVDNLAVLYINKIQDLYKQVEVLEKKKQSKPITEWKKEYTTKNDITGNIELKDTNSLSKHIELASLYKEYQSKLHQKGLFDFDDMLIEVNQAFQKHPSLAYKYQERYLYTLVDEFQDTNQTQSTLLHLLVDNEYSEGEPNILAVADDDQAIYKFQGANMKNITDFINKYPKTTVITLTHNYRSHQKILDLSKAVIEQSSLRLSNSLNIPKPLLAGISHKEEQVPRYKNFQTREEEILFIAKQVQVLIENGVNPDEIAIITRQHKQLLGVVKIFDHLQIPIRYDRGQNVLDQPIIQQIIHILRFIVTVNKKHKQESDELLPTILSFGVFGLNPHTIYKVSHIAYKNRLNWLEVMSDVALYNKNDKDSKPDTSKEPFTEVESMQLYQIADFLLSLAKACEVETAEQILDRILGVSDAENLPDNEMEGEADNDLLPKTKKFYFSFKDWLSKEPDYLLYLSGLKVFFSTLRNYQPKDTIIVEDVLEFIDIIETNKLSLIDNSPFNQSEKAVNLMTAHKAKGLEFDYVFIVDVIQSVWAKSGKVNKIKLPINMPYMAQKDDIDDHIRLFFVALTRAKKTLYLTSFTKDESNKDTQKLEFLVEQEHLMDSLGVENKEIDFFLADKTNILQVWLLGELTQRTLSLDQKEWLRPSLENYKLSVTHLNNFIDVVHGGPQLFLEQNLLRFPKSKSFSAAYGTAMHEAVAQFYRVYKSQREIPHFDIMFKAFESSLLEQRLTYKQESDGLKKGLLALTHFYEQKKHTFDLKHDIEVDFKNQNVRIGNASITGKLDQIWYDQNSNNTTVVDLKTGKSTDRWLSSDDAANLKIGRYKRQLVFYRLLMENSRDFAHYSVTNGALVFLEPDKKDGNKIKTLEMTIGEEDTNNMRQLIRAVWKCITTLEFPNIDKYEKNDKGVENFIQDLIGENENI
jgi:DNA helicase II / ATP-dependent DNA helicase PcrA